MELISRITVRRHEMGEEGGAAASKSLAIFRVLGKSPQWFPSIPTFVSSHEADGGRPAAKPAQ